MGFSKRDIGRSFPSMLLQTVVSPMLLSRLPTDEVARKLFCNVWLGVLVGFVENCVMILPQARVTESDYLSALDAWPPKYRKRAQELIVLLRQRRRLQPSSVSPVSATCTEATCKPFVVASLANVATFHFSEESCMECLRSQALDSRAVVPLDYFISDFSRLRRSKTAHILADGEWNMVDFEREVLLPLFASAKHVKIYDRYIGRSVFNRQRNTIRFNAHYKRNLEWIVDCFRRSGGLARGGVFEIYCGIEAHVVPSHLRPAARTEVQSFAATLQSASGIPVTMFLKEESNTAQCPHGRYLITDQLALLVERGFDLLWDDGRMRSAGLHPALDPRRVRDVAVVRCDSCNSAETQARLLPAF
jgi:hypothetical protein